MKFTDDVIEKERLRELCYRLLSACYCAPEEDIDIKQIVDDLSIGLRALSPMAAAYLEDMKRAAAEMEHETLLVDYSKLFLGPFKLIAPPYGSVYLEEERCVMGKSTVDVIGRYRRAGLAMDEYLKEIPDHIGVELEFVSYLISRGISSLIESDAVAACAALAEQEDFLVAHPGAWVEKFKDAIVDGTDNLFYKSLATCTSSFLTDDLERVRHTIEELSGDAVVTS